MNAAELKINLFRKIDMLNDDELSRLYGDLINVINGTVDNIHWQNLSLPQKNGIKNAIASLEKGNGIAHEEVMKKYRKRYSK